MTRSSPFLPAFGISSYAYTWSLGVAGHVPSAIYSATDLLWEAERLGARRLQLADNLPIHELAETGWSGLMAAARDSGIQLELGIRGLTEDRLLQYLSYCRDCHSPFLRVVIDEGGYTPSHAEIVAVIRRVLPDFRREGVVLAIENHDRFRAYELVDLIAATDPAAVGICLDTANSLGADEGIYEVTRLLAPYTINLHVKDYCIQRYSHSMGFTVTGRPAGEGQLPLDWLLHELAGYGRCQSATLETWSLPLDNPDETAIRERDWTARGAAYLSDRFGRIHQSTPVILDH